jgi:hypothetical protein
MIISMEIAVSSISNKVLQLHLVQERFAYVLRVALFPYNAGIWCVQVPAIKLCCQIVIKNLR